MISLFPTINALLNATAGIFLLLGWRAIRAKDQMTHRKYMILALISSALFLASYITYHALSQGVTRYQGEGFLRIVYFFILLTHTPLAAIIIPFCLMAVRHAVRGEYQKHIAITRWLFPVWGYVSVTGILIYLMLYVFS